MLLIFKVAKLFKIFPNYIPPLARGARIFRKGNYLLISFVTYFLKRAELIRPLEQSSL